MFRWREILGLQSWQDKRNALHHDIATDVMEEVHKILSVDWVLNQQGKPYVNDMSAAVRNARIANLNLKYFGYELARSFAANLPPPPQTPPAAMDLGSKPSTQSDIESDWIRYWCGQLGIPVVYHRKLWELGYVLQALHENGMLREGVRGLGFGCGTEPIPSYLAAQGVRTTVTDLPADRAQAAGWADTNQHAGSLDAVFHPHLVDRARFDSLVSAETVDMNAIPTHLRGFDFCWSICALEHLGTIDLGLAFIENALETLRPGGIAVHTTELNVEASGPTFDAWPTVLFQRQHLEALADRLAARGHRLATLDFDFGEKPLDHFVDLPPWPVAGSPVAHQWSESAPHLKVAVDGFVSTCFGLIVRKAD